MLHSISFFPPTLYLPSCTFTKINHRPHHPYITTYSILYPTHSFPYFLLHTPLLPLREVGIHDGERIGPKQRNCACFRRYHSFPQPLHLPSCTFTKIIGPITPISLPILPLLPVANPPSPLVGRWTSMMEKESAQSSGIVCVLHPISFFPPTPISTYLST